MNNIISVIDIGSNSVKMRTAYLSKKDLRVIYDHTEVTKLAGKLQNNRIRRESMLLTLEALRKMIDTSHSLNSNEVIIVATMALRSAENAAEFLELVFKETGYKVRVLTGYEEAYYSWLGAVYDFDNEKYMLMFDSGGGSTEFVLGCADKIIEAVSVPLGAVNLTEKFFATNGIINLTSIKSAVSFIKDKFSEYGVRAIFEKCNADLNKIIGVGGGICAIANVKIANEIFVPSKLHGLEVTLSDLRKQIELYASLTLKERSEIIGLPSNRADIILSSACIIREIMELFIEVSGKKSYIKVSINGLRNGILLNALRGE